MTLVATPSPKGHGSRQFDGLVSTSGLEPENQDAVTEEHEDCGNGCEAQCARLGVLGQTLEDSLLTHQNFKFAGFHFV